MSESNANAPAGSQMISVRLPEPILKRLGKLAGHMGSSRTDVVRRALAVYFRLGEAVLVPVSAQTRAALNRLAESEGRSAEVVSEEIFEFAVSEKTPHEAPVILRFSENIVMELDQESRATNGYSPITHNLRISHA
ncbi:ribbon-helix-helix protein, CopG family [Deinococcus sp.]|uniref:ribbon-helix-helix protein, CopG family n=1 Tax=Deinococcus sp. TaxID=47478 RepID=UPI003B5B47BC